MRSPRDLDIALDLLLLRTKPAHVPHSGSNRHVQVTTSRAPTVTLERVPSDTEARDAGDALLQLFPGVKMAAQIAVCFLLLGLVLSRYGGANTYFVVL